MRIPYLIRSSENVRNSWFLHLKILCDNIDQRIKYWIKKVLRRVWYVLLGLKTFLQEELYMISTMLSVYNIYNDKYSISTRISVYNIYNNKCIQYLRTSINAYNIYNSATLLDAVCTILCYGVYVVLILFCANLFYFLILYS